MAENRKLVLLIADCPDEQALTLRALHQGGLHNEVVVVRSGDEAIEFAGGTGCYADRNVGRRPNLILLDLTSPHVEGHRVLRQLRGHIKTRLIPVVVLTTSHNKEDLDNGFSHGANSLVLKPVDTRKLADTLGQVVRYWLHLNETTP